jgi:predicted amidohydrolase
MIRIALAQQDFLVGDIKGNLCKAIELINGARERGADLLLFPELALAGYPPEDLLLPRLPGESTWLSAIPGWKTECGITAPAGFATGVL